MTNVPFINSITNELSKRKLKSAVVANAILDIVVGNDRLDNLIANGVTHSDLESLTIGGLTTEQTAAIEKINGLEASASAIDAVSNVIDSRLAPIHKLFRQASNLISTDVTYIVAGDSTRDNIYNEMKDYYIKQLGKINVSIFYSSRSGGTAKKWFNNTQDKEYARLSAAITSSTGIEGENTILEYSYGLNDYLIERANKAIVKASITDGIVAYMTAMPKAFVFLAFPTTSSNPERDIMLDEIYTEIATELDLFYVNTKLCTASIAGNSLYYADATHPNKFGSRRIVNFILDKIMPIELAQIVTLEEYIVNPSTNTMELNVAPFVEVGNWYTTTGGNGKTNTTWRRTKKIAIEPNFTLEIISKGERFDALFYDAAGVFLNYTTTSLVSGDKREVVIPAGAYFVGFNITENGASYDLLSDVPSVKYAISGGTFMSIDNINVDLKIRNRINPYVDGMIIDAYGKKGMSGQTLTIDANSKMKWA